VIVTVTLNAALHVAYKVLALPPPGGDPPVTPRTGGCPPPRTPLAPLARSLVLPTGQAGAG